MAAKIVFITESYFVKNAGFVEMLNMGDVVKQSTRLYLAINSNTTASLFCWNTDLCRFHGLRGLV